MVTPAIEAQVGDASRLQHIALHNVKQRLELRENQNPVPGVVSALYRLFFRRRHALRVPDDATLLQSRPFQHLRIKP